MKGACHIPRMKCCVVIGPVAQRPVAEPALGASRVGPLVVIDPEAACVCLSVSVVVDPDVGGPVGEHVSFAACDASFVVVDSVGGECYVGCSRICICRG